MLLKRISKFFICTIITAAVVVQCGCSALNFRYEYDRGMKAYNEKNYDEAIIYFNNALNYKPDSYSALCLLGTSYAYKKETQLAEKTFQDAIKLFPNQWNAYVLLGDIKRNQKDYEVAIDYYETAVTLESMGGKEKLYYKKLLKQIEAEQAAYAMSDPQAKQQSVENLKTEIVNTYTNKKTKIEEPEPTGEVFLTLDTKKWEKALEQKDEKSSVTEYGLKGEDVKNFKWTQLVTIQYFVITDNFNTTLNEYYNTHIGVIEAIAKNSNKPFEKKIIHQTKNDILYEWKFDNAKETELARVIFSKDRIYHIHFAKKGQFTNEEKAKYIDILKTAVLR